MRIYSFAPVLRADARILILGSMPGVASLNATQYYAHRRNQFWEIMGKLFGAGRDLPYPERLQRLQDQGLALWDVLHSCVREGSLDAAIEHHTAAANDLPALLRRAASLERICCNGGTAHAALKRYFGQQLAQDFPHLQQLQLPSSSPANARWTLARKLSAWNQALS